MKVYILIYTCNWRGFFKIVGVYSTEEKAERAREADIALFANIREGDAEEERDKYIIIERELE